MLKRYIIILVTSILIVIFAVQNVDKIGIRLWMFDVQASLSLVIIVTLSAGALVTLLFSYQEIRDRNKKIRELEKKLKNSEKSYTTEGYNPGDEKDLEI